MGTTLPRICRHADEERVSLRVVDQAVRFARGDPDGVPCLDCPLFVAYLHEPAAVEDEIDLLHLVHVLLYGVARRQGGPGEELHGPEVLTREHHPGNAAPVRPIGCRADNGVIYVADEHILRIIAQRVGRPEVGAYGVQIFVLELR